MQIVIEMSEEDYRKVKDGRASVSSMRDAIINGTPLPKGHGRLIDADYLDVEEIVTDDYSNNKELKVILKEDLDDAPTIIPADKGDNE